MTARERARVVRVPIMEPLDLRTMWEHTPLDYYRYGEYPRWIRPVGAHQPRWGWRHVAAAVEAGDWP